MNYGISVLFRAIPLLMALFCFGYGFFVFNYGVDSSRFVAGPVVFSLGFICIALFATAATIIRQIIHTYNNVARFALPILGYLSATITFLAGFILLMSSPAPADFVAGHVICGVGLITACVATTATASSPFTLKQRLKRLYPIHLNTNERQKRRSQNTRQSVQLLAGGILDPCSIIYIHSRMDLGLPVASA